MGRAVAAVRRRLLAVLRRAADVVVMVKEAARVEEPLPWTRLRSSRAQICLAS